MIKIKAVLAANKELLKLYWYIGQTITEKQQKSDWGPNIIKKLSNRSFFNIYLHLIISLLFESLLIIW
jgi:hypothetical protein